MHHHALPDVARQAAIDHVRRATGEDALVVHEIVSEPRPGGGDLHHVVLYGQAGPNEALFEVIVDDAGAVHDPADLDAAVVASFSEARPIETRSRAAVPPLSPPPATPPATPATSPDPSAPPTAEPTAEPPPVPAPITVAPTSNDLTLAPGDGLAETITVDIPRGSGVRKVDVYFLADTTGSMRHHIAAVKSGANAILSQLAALGIDMAFGVGSYRDLPATNPPFSHQHAPSADAESVTAAIDAWSASGGGDISEGQLFALDALAQAPGADIGWRPAAKRIVVWFGDAPGHDPICNAISGKAYDITEATATAKLVAHGIIVLAISTTLAAGLDADPAASAQNYAALCSVGGTPGQGTRIAAATGGQYVWGVNAATIVQIMTDLIANAATTIGSLTLEASGAADGFVASISPAGGYGPLTLANDQQKDFEVAFLGHLPCGDEAQRFEGTLDVVADGVVVAQTTLAVTVPACDQGPEPQACPGLQAPQAAIDAALAQPAQVAGWLETCNKNRPFDPLHNPYRTRLQLLNPNLAYDELANPVVFKCGCG